MSASEVLCASWENYPEVDALGGSKHELIANFNHFLPYSSKKCILSWAVLRREGRLIGAAPVVRLIQSPLPMMLVPRWRRRLSWLSPLIRKTTLLVDTSFLAYDAASPFLAAPGEDHSEIRQQLCNFLLRERKVDTVWISEPEDEAWLCSGGGWDQFLTLPIARIGLDKICSFDEYLAGLSQKRRRNYRKENQAFIAAGAKIECVEGPLSRDSKLLRSLTKFLRASEARATVYAPFNNVMINPSAFATQKQALLVASICNKPVGFIAFVHAGEGFMQVHGGLDYQQSELIFAYHNLIYAGIREAISRGLRLVTMGPLNNETKRRASTELVPMVVSVKNHSLIDRLLARNWFYPRMGAYVAPCRKGA